MRLGIQVAAAIDCFVSGAVQYQRSRQYVHMNNQQNPIVAVFIGGSHDAKREVLTCVPSLKSLVSRVSKSDGTIERYVRVDLGPDLDDLLLFAIEGMSMKAVVERLVIYYRDDDPLT